MSLLNSFGVLQFLSLPCLFLVFFSSFSVAVLVQWELAALCLFSFGLKILYKIGRFHISEKSEAS